MVTSLVVFPWLVLVARGRLPSWRGRRPLPATKVLAQDTSCSFICLSLAGIPCFLGLWAGALVGAALASK